MTKYKGLTFNELIHLGLNQSLRDILDVWKHDWTLEFQGRGFRCEDLILLCFCLQMLDYKMLKPRSLEIPYYRLSSAEDNESPG